MKQKKAFELAMENGGNISKAMKEAGYAVATAKNPDKLTKSKTWADMMEEYLPDETLLKVNAEGLQATRAVVMGTKSEESFVDIQPDYAIRHKYLETAIKVKGHIKTDTPPVNNTQINILDKTTGEKMVANFAEFMKEQTKGGN